ncbi:MAG: hypothetical protein JWM98_3247, partial [Thermoleophilia bacterium]|nr:hypothetical protein [Thermoleophilia bacterium]
MASLAPTPHRAADAASTRAPGARGVAAATQAPAPDARRATRAWIAGSVLVAVVLRLPFLTTPLRLDEG